MGVVMFYHLTRSSMDEVVDMLVPRALVQGWRVMIRSPDRSTLERQDARFGCIPTTGSCRTAWKAVPATPSNRCCWAAGRP